MSVQRDANGSYNGRGSSDKNLVQTSLLSWTSHKNQSTCRATTVSKRAGAAENEICSNYDTTPMSSGPLSKNNVSQISSCKSSTVLAAVARETKDVLARLLASEPSIQPVGRLYTSMHALHQHRNPRMPPATVQVLDADTLDVALDLLQHPSTSNNGKSRRTNTPLLLNMANARVGGGGWLAGALAQEESLCYRSSLSLTLKRRFYPLGEMDAIYSPTVVVVRDSLAAGHQLIDMSSPLDLPIVSVVSVPALRDPPTLLTFGGEGRYERDTDRQCMLEKMRVVLRVAGMTGHTQLILGALGCGAFGNPREEVARMWREVLSDKEFEGWFELIIFAVLGSNPNPNWRVFRDELQGLVV